MTTWLVLAHITIGLDIFTCLSQATGPRFLPARRHRFPVGSGRHRDHGGSQETKARVVIPGFPPVDWPQDSTDHDQQTVLRVHCSQVVLRGNDSLSDAHPTVTSTISPLVPMHHPRLHTIILLTCPQCPQPMGAVCFPPSKGSDIKDVDTVPPAFLTPQ